MDYPYDVGSYSRPVTTASSEAQCWFDRGLNWCFGYHHEEAVRCFEKALEIDPSCAMAHWGVGYATGPNYNYPWELQDPAGKAAALAGAYVPPAPRSPSATVLRRRNAPSLRLYRRAIRNAIPLTISVHGITPLPKPCAWRIKHTPTTSMFVRSSWKQSLTAHLGACGTCGPASRRLGPGRSRRARCSSLPFEICPEPSIIPAFCICTST